MAVEPTLLTVAWLLAGIYNKYPCRGICEGGVLCDVASTRTRQCDVGLLPAFRSLQDIWLEFL